MACTQRKWCDFVIFLPAKCGKKGDLVIQRTEFDNAKWTAAEELISRYIIYNAFLKLLPNNKLFCNLHEYFFRFYISYVIPEIIQGDISGDICRTQQLCAIGNDTLPLSNIDSVHHNPVELNLGMFKSLSM